jgi:hypothetical protein
MVCKVFGLGADIVKPSRLLLGHRGLLSKLIPEA